MPERRQPPPESPLGPPDVEPEEKARQLYGDEPPEDQDAVVTADEIDELGTLTDTEVYEGELEAGGGAAAERDRYELLTERELRAGETDDPTVAAEEGMTYVPPTDPPIVPSAGPQDAEVAAGFGATSMEEPYDGDHHATSLTAEDEVTARVREALRADAATSEYADRVGIETDGRTVVLRGTVRDVDDTDNLVEVASRVSGVVEVRDELEVEGL